MSYGSDLFVLFFPQTF